MSEPAPARRGKNLKHVRDVFEYLCDKFPAVSYVEDVLESDYAKVTIVCFNAYILIFKLIKTSYVINMAMRFKHK
jgi:hypothetical protein